MNINTNLFTLKPELVREYVT